MELALCTRTEILEHVRSLHISVSSSGEPIILLKSGGGGPSARSPKYIFPCIVKRLPIRAQNYDFRQRSPPSVIGYMGSFALPRPRGEPAITEDEMNEWVLRQRTAYDNFFFLCCMITYTLARYVPAYRAAFRAKERATLTKAHRQFFSRRARAVKRALEMEGGVAEVENEKRSRLAEIEVDVMVRVALAPIMPKFILIANSRQWIDDLYKDSGPVDVGGLVCPSSTSWVAGHAAIRVRDTALCTLPSYEYDASLLKNYDAAAFNWLMDTRYPPFSEEGIRMFSPWEGDFRLSDASSLIDYGDLVNVVFSFVGDNERLTIAVHDMVNQMPLQITA